MLAENIWVINAKHLNQLEKNLECKIKYLFLLKRL